MGNKINEDQLKNQVKEGAKLAMALKSEPGIIIVDHLIELLDRNLTQILMGQETMEADEILNKVSECHGIVAALGGMGDKIRYTSGFIARRNSEQALGR